MAAISSHDRHSGAPSKHCPRYNFVYTLDDHAPVHGRHAHLYHFTLTCPTCKIFHLSYAFGPPRLGPITPLPKPVEVKRAFLSTSSALSPAISCLIAPVPALCPCIVLRDRSRSGEFVVRHRYLITSIMRLSNAYIYGVGVPMVGHDTCHANSSLPPR